MWKLIIGYFGTGFIFLFLSVPVSAEGITREQGEAILKELQSIHKELEEIKQKQQAVPVAAQPAAQSPKNVSVATLGNPMLGKLDAPVTLVEFTDFQCPYCRRFFANTLTTLRKDYIDTGKLRLVLRDLPLDFHSDARLAAKAAHCAGEQDRYWQMHNAMFAGKKGLKQAQLMQMAKSIGLDQQALKSCLASKRYDEGIAQDIADAGKISVSGTPSFVIGRTTDNMVEGKLIVGAKPTEYFVNQINALLKQE